MADVALPSALSLARYRLTLKAVEPLHLPPYKGSALRGGVGHVFKRLACTQPWPCGERCVGGNACAYGYIFETRPPEGSQVLSKNEHVPHPFVIEPPLDRRGEYPPGEMLAFDLVLVGQAQEYLYDFVRTFSELGRVGLGAGRGRFRVTHVEAVHPLSGETAAAYDESRPDEMVIPHLPVTAAEIEARAASLPADEIRLRFLTPTRLIQDKAPVESPPFRVLAQRLVERVSSLCYFHCGQRWEMDFASFVEQAAQVEQADCRTRWLQVERYSGRQQERVSLGGFVGDVAYRGNSSPGSGQGLAPFRSLFLLGSLVHVGKATIFGNGLYRIEMGDSDSEGR